MGTPRRARSQPASDGTEWCRSSSRLHRRLANRVDAEVLEDPELVARPPALDDLAVLEPADLQNAHLDRLTGGRDGKAVVSSVKNASMLPAFTFSARCSWAAMLSCLDMSASVGFAVSAAGLRGPWSSLVAVVKMLVGVRGLGQRQLVGDEERRLRLAGIDQVAQLAVVGLDVGLTGRPPLSLEPERPEVKRDLALLGQLVLSARILGQNTPTTPMPLVARTEATDCSSSGSGPRRRCGRAPDSPRPHSRSPLPRLSRHRRLSRVQVGPGGTDAIAAQEVAELGIHVTLVEPGPYGTGWLDIGSRRSEEIAAYAAVRDASVARGSLVTHTPPAPRSSRWSMLPAAPADLLRQDSAARRHRGLRVPVDRVERVAAGLSAGVRLTGWSCAAVGQPPPPKASLSARRVDQNARSSHGISFAPNARTSVASGEVWG